MLEWEINRTRETVLRARGILIEIAELLVIEHQYELKQKSYTGFPDYYDMNAIAVDPELLAMVIDHPGSRLVWNFTRGTDIAIIDLTRGNSKLSMTDSKLFKTLAFACLDRGKTSNFK